MKIITVKNSGTLSTNYDHSTKKLQKISHLIHTTNTKTYTNATSYIFKEPDGLSGNQRYHRELLMMGIMVPETC